MKYLVRKSVVDVVGRIWMPQIVCSLRIVMSDYDLDNARDGDGRITRDSLEYWLCTHAGDFSQIIDFRASIEDVDESIRIDFAIEEGESQYLDTISEMEEA